MLKITISLSLAALALGACTTYETRPANAVSTAPIITQQTTYRAGIGTVERVIAYPGSMQSAAGGTASSASRLNRLVVRMDDGTVQYVDTDATEFGRAARIELLPDRTIRKVQ